MKAAPTEVRKSATRDLVKNCESAREEYGALFRESESSSPRIWRALVWSTEPGIRN